MSTNEVVWGVKITLASEFTQDTDIGLYTSGGESWFRWIEADMSGTSVAYKAGIIDSIPPLDEGFNGARGGDFVNLKAITLNILNTNQFYKELDDAGIGINGLRCEVIEFSKAVGGSVTETTRGYFQTSVKEWDVKNYQLPLEPSSYNRNAAMGTQVDEKTHPDAGPNDIGKTVPCTFGEMNGGIYAKMVRTLSKENTLNSATLAGYVVDGGGSKDVRPLSTHFPVLYQPMRTMPYSGLSGTFQDGERVTSAAGGNAYIASDNGSNSMTLFAVTGTFSGSVVTGLTSGAACTAGSLAVIDPDEPNLDYMIDIGLQGPLGLDGSQDPTDLYIKITDNENGLVGQFKAVDHIAHCVGLYYLVRLKQYTTVNLTPDADGNGDWIQVIQIDKEYESDIWPLEDFSDYSGTKLSRWEVEYDNLSGTFSTGEQVTGGTTGATATVEDDRDGDTLIVTKISGGFEDNEQITGSSSGATADVNGDPTREDGTPELYSYNNDARVTVDPTATTDQVVPVTSNLFEYILVPQFGYDVTGLQDNNQVTIEAWLFENEPDTMLSYFGQPIDPDTLELMRDNPSVYQSDVTVSKRIQDGLFIVSGQYAFPNASVTLTGREYVADRDDQTRCDLTLSDEDYNDATHVAEYILGVEFVLPSAPEQLKYDRAFLGLDIRSSVRPQAFNLQGDANVKAWVNKRRFIGTGTEVLDQSTYGRYYFDINNEDLVSGRIDDMLDQYFYNTRDLKNLFFYVNPVKESTIIGNEFLTIRNRELFQIDDYDRNYKIGIMFYRKLGNGGANAPLYPPLVDGVDFQQICVFFEKKIPIGEALYTTCRGRIYNDTWGSRKVPADLIDNPADQYEHACRLQSWADAGDTSVEYGKAYSSSALINVASGELSYDNLSGTFTDGEQITGGTSTATAYIHRDNGTDKMLITRVSGVFQDDEEITGGGSGATADVNGAVRRAEGGFDSPRLNDLRDRRYSYQILDYAKSWTKRFKQDMLLASWSVGYINEYGEECMAFLPKVDSDTITDSITLADVPDGMNPSGVTEPQPKDVFCEPFVRYAWNPGAKKFDGIISIKQVHRGAYSSDYTPGFGSGEGEQFWTFCHEQLWDRYHQIETPPSNLTDQYFISTYDDAKWFLTTWLDWMLVRRVTVPVYYEKGKDWHVGKHVYLTLPHQTDGVQQEAVIERIRKHRASNTCEVSLAYWVETPADFYIKDVMYTAGEGADADWKDTMDTGNTQYKDVM